MKKLILIFLGTLLSLAALGSDQLLFAVLVTRHGDRAPFAQIKNTNYDWCSSAAELTPIGMNQEYNLGSMLRQKYVHDNKLLADKYVPNSILTYSSNTNRTIMSAQCLLLGLYPPGTGPTVDGDNNSALPDRIQVIPVRTVPDSSTLILTPYPLYLKLLQKYVYPTKEWKEAEALVKSKMQEWSDEVGYDIKSLGDVLTVGDVLICVKSHNLSYPVELDEKDAKEIINITNTKLALQFKVGELSYLMGGQLLNAIASNIDDFINDKQPYKLVYYSGHDITILPLMSLLGNPLDKAPGYASNLVVELWKDDNSAYYIKVCYYKGYVKLPIMKGTDKCSYDDFKKLVESVNEKYKDLKLPE